MPPLVVEPFDIVKRRPLDVLNVAPRFLAVIQYGLVVTVEALREGVDAPRSQDLVNSPQKVQRAHENQS